MSEQEQTAHEQTEDHVEVKRMPGTLFPYEEIREHWDINFNDTKQSYEGSSLPWWILAGWAAFIIWAVLYLVAGLPTAF